METGSRFVPALLRNCYCCAGRALCEDGGLRGACGLADETIVCTRSPTGGLFAGPATQERDGGYDASMLLHQQLRATGPGGEVVKHEPNGD